MTIPAVLPCTRREWRKLKKDRIFGHTISDMSPAERLMLEACTKPPTTAEWLDYLKRTDDPHRFYRSGKLFRRPRPFIRPRTRPLGHVTTGGYWWRDLP